MASANYVLIEKISVGAAGASSVTFSGIPQTGYTDLVVKLSSRTSRSAGNEDIYLEFNGSGGTAYAARRLYATSSGAASDTSSSVAAIEFYSTDGNTATASTFGSAEIYIPNYTSANYKSVSIDAISENNSTAAIEGMTAGLWSNTAAITSIKLTPVQGGSFVQYSTFYLYGVAKLGTTPAIVPYATGGDTVMTDGTYWYHTFISSGTFTPLKGLTADYLVVAGGGAGGGLGTNSDATGGGGAGGLRSTVTATGGGGSLESALSLSTTGYTVTVGAGGAGTTTTGASGSNSVFSTITSTAGGGGGGYLTAGLSGGSGGGGGQNAVNGAGTNNQGFAGQTGVGGNYGGGGGAGAVGTATAFNGTNKGGAGVAVSISGSSVNYAGGGNPGGSSGNTFGGGNGDYGLSSNNATAGTANTGGGGGGKWNNNGASVSGGNGGSGIVIVRYAV